MDANVINELKSGLSAAYINGSLAANLAYKPAFISNNPEEGKKVISSVEDELLRCEEFQISVAFITLGGVTPLLQTLKELEKKGVKGQILIGGYKFDKKTKTFPVFINYDKSENISDTTKYEDHFVAENRLIAISKSG